MIRKSFVKVTGDIFAKHLIRRAANRMTSKSSTNSSKRLLNSLEQTLKQNERGLWARLLYELILEFRPSACLELGTCLGFSAAYQAEALRHIEEANLVSLEGSDSSARIARENMARLGYKNVEIVTGRFSETLAIVCESKGPFSYVFIDGHHDEHATIKYFNQLIPHLTSTAVVVIDDISWSGGMRRAWQELCSKSVVGVCVDLYVVGVLIVNDSHGGHSQV